MRCGVPMRGMKQSMEIEFFPIHHNLKPQDYMLLQVIATQLLTLHKLNGSKSTIEEG
jgi:hypothetical protein